MRLVGFEQAVPASSSVSVTLDLSRVARYLLWAYVFNVQWVEFRKRNDIIASACGMDSSGSVAVSPCFVFEETGDPITVTLWNTGSSPVTASVVFAVDDELYGDLIDKNFHLRTGILGWNLPGTVDDAQLVKNERQNADFVALRLAFYNQAPKWLRTSWGEEILSPIDASPYGPTLMHINTRLRPSEYIAGSIYVVPAVPFTGADVIYWELPCGEDVPEEFVPPALWMKPRHTPVFPWKPDVWPPTPPSAEWPSWAVGAPAELVDVSFIGYPPTPYQRTLLTPTIQETAFWDLSGDIKGMPYGRVVLPWKNVPGVTGIIGIGPTGVHLVRCDDIGRVRHTDKAITYKSGKVEKTDTSTTTITPERPASRVCFKAVALGWEVKVLTLYDLLRGKTISDVDTIYLDEGDSFTEPLEAVEIQVSCPTASGSSTGKLYYYVGI